MARDGFRAQMNDLWRILEASSKAGSGPAALATVVRAKGSTYRRAGARMLITGDGETIGAVSGGCLEEEIAARAQDVMRGGEPCILSFDTRVTHGCNGFVEVLVERVSRENADVLGFAARRIAAREQALIASIFRSTGEKGPKLGSHGFEAGRESSLPWEGREDALGALTDGRSIHRSYGWGECFFDVIQPPIRLVIIGAGHDAGPMARLGKTLGWAVNVVAHPAGPAPDPVLGEVADLQVLNPSEFAANLVPDAFTAVVVMSHHFGRDMAFLGALLSAQIPYLGLLGPRKRREQMLMELADSQGSFDPADLQKLHSPIGLDLGAEYPEEIALSIAAEIRAVLSRSTAKSLRECKGPIHPQPGAPAADPFRQMLA